MDAALPDPARGALIEQLHAAPEQLVLEFAGAGSLALFWLHSVGGSSRTLLEATDRYSRLSLQELLGQTPAQFVSPETAAEMAVLAYLRARRLSGGNAAVLGVGLTATIATDRAKRGDHRVCLAVQTAGGLTTDSLTLTKGARDRLTEERVVAELALFRVAGACGLEALAPTLLPEEHLESTSGPAPDPVSLLLDGRARTVLIHGDGRREPEAVVRGALLSGSFHPLHAGHEQLAAAAAAQLGLLVTYELPVWNADKPPLSREEIERRVGQFAGKGPVALSRAPLFHEKAALYPGCTFVIGHDTAVRLLDARYYGSEVARQRTFAVLRDRGCRFLVAGRYHQGRYQELDLSGVPADLQDLFDLLPESGFRLDISSTELRGSRNDD